MQLEHARSHAVNIAACGAQRKQVVGGLWQWCKNGVVLPCSAHDHRSHDDSKVATSRKARVQVSPAERVWGPGGFSALQKRTFDFVEKGVAPSDV